MDDALDSERERWRQVRHTRPTRMQIDEGCCHEICQVEHQLLAINEGECCKGAEAWASRAAGGIFTPKGQPISSTIPAANFVPTMWKVKNATGPRPGTARLELPEGYD